MTVAIFATFVMSIALMPSAAWAATATVNSPAEWTAALNDPSIDTIALGSSFSITGRALSARTLTLDLNGQTLNSAGLDVSAGQTFTISDSTGAGTLNASAPPGSSAGIGTSGATLVISGGTVNASANQAAGSSGGAGIGGSGGRDGGTVRITGGTVNATGASSGSGIGAGNTSGVFAVEISGGTVTAYAPYSGAGIGSGGSNMRNTPGGSIKISGGTVTASSGYYGAGIGAGFGLATPPTVEISGGTVNATGGQNAAGIGTGYYTSWDGPPSGAVTITGGTVTATGAPYAAGIGGGAGLSAGPITITGGTVTAISPKIASGSGGGAAGIGGGQLGEAGPITIGGNAVVTAGGDYGAVGPGSRTTGPLTLDIAEGAILKLASDQIVPANSTVTGFGKITANPAGQLRTITNNGIIIPWVNDVVFPAGDVQVVNVRHLVTFDPQNGDPTTPVPVYAPSFDTGVRYFPADPTNGSQVFTGWNTAPDGSGTWLTRDQELVGDFPVYAVWKVTHPAVSIVKKDAEGNDANTAAEAVQLDDGSVELAFVITNTGDEALGTISVTDSITGAGTLSAIECTFADDTAQLAVGQSMTCTATLSGVTDAHEDVATVTALGTESAIEVSASDPYFAKPTPTHTDGPGTPTDPGTPDGPGTPTDPGTPTNPSSPVTPSGSAWPLPPTAYPALPITGVSGAAQLMGFGVLLIAAGAMIAAVGRARRR